jgi:hypothetical protein
MTSDNMNFDSLGIEDRLASADAPVAQGTAPLL